MRRFIAIMLFVQLMLLLLPQSAQAVDIDELEISAQSAILMDSDSGRVLYEKDSGQRLPIASVTKLMTALVAVTVCEDLDETVVVRAQEAATEGSTLYLKAGEVISVRALLYGLLLESGNDAARVLARHLAGEEAQFVEWMNQRAVTLGMKDTQFVNPSGLSGEGQYSTAYDVALLSRAVLADELLSEIVATKSITIGGRLMTNHNKLLWDYEGCIGLKTGYTDEAGRTLASAAERDGQRLICVTLRDPNDWSDHAALFDYGFSNYEQRQLVQSGEHYRAVSLHGALEPYVLVVPSSSLSYPLATNETLRVEIDLPDWVQAPVQQGSIAGTLRYYLADEQVAFCYLVYDKSVQDNSIASVGFRAFFRNTAVEGQISALSLRVQPAFSQQVQPVSAVGIRKNYYKFAPFSG